MPEDRLQRITTTTAGSGSRYVFLGVLIVVGLVGLYVAIGAPGLHIQVANAPAGNRGEQPIELTAEQPAATAPAPTPTGQDRR